MEEKKKKPELTNYYFFDYIFLFVYNFYSKFKSEKETAKITSVLLLSLLQLFNIILLYFIFKIFTNTNFIPNNKLTLGFCAIVILLNWLIYNRKDISLLRSKYQSHSKKRKKIIIIFAIFYAIFSLPFTIFLFVIW